MVYKLKNALYSNSKKQIILTIICFLFCNITFGQFEKNGFAKDILIINVNKKKLRNFEERPKSKAIEVGEILKIEKTKKILECQLLDAGQSKNRIKFKTGKYPWDGIDEEGKEYSLTSNSIFSYTSDYPKMDDIAGLQFGDGFVYYCYVIDKDSLINVVLLNYPYLKLSINSENEIVKSAWYQYPEGTTVILKKYIYSILNKNKDPKIRPPF